MKSKKTTFRGGDSSPKNPVKVTILSFVYFIVTFAILFPFAALDFDKHHDGYILGTAIGINSGLIQFKEVFSQYGPISPVLQSLAVSFSDQPMLNIRLFNVFLISLTSALFVNTLRFKHLEQNYFRVAALFTPIIWVLTFDSIYGNAMLPWNSTLFVVNQVLVLNIILSFMSNLHKENWQQKKLLPFSLGILTTLSIFIRINTGLLMSFGIVTVSVLVYFIIKSKIVRNKIRIFLLSFLITFTILNLILVANSSWIDYFEQAIALPRSLMLSEFILGVWNPIAVIKSYIIDSLLFLGFVCIYFFGNKRILKLKILQKEKKLISGIFSCSIIFLCGKEFLFNIYQQTYTDSKISSILLSRIFVLFLGIAIYFFITSLKQVRKKFRETEHEVESLLMDLFLLILAFSGITQMYPTTDVRHIWWGIPLGMYFIIKVLTKYLERPKSQFVFQVFSPILILLLITALISGTNTLKYKREVIDFGALKNMKVSEEQYLLLKEENDFLQKNVLLVKGARYKCRDGYYAVFNSEYNAGTKWFVDWTHYDSWKPKNFEDSFIGMKNTLFCGGSTDAENYAASINGIVVRKSATISIIQGSPQSKSDQK
jgi:hypothetical protein